MPRREIDPILLEQRSSNNQSIRGQPLILIEPAGHAYPAREQAGRYDPEGFIQRREKRNALVINLQF